MTQSKKTLYVGGLDESVDERALTELFTPFGDVVNVVLPIDEKNDKRRGFGFVEFEEAEDAFHALENLHKGEFFGRVLAVSIAKPDAYAKNKALWENPEYFEKKLAGREERMHDQGPEVEGAEQDDDAMDLDESKRD